MDLRDQLQHTLGDAYTIERELGGGGMSRVFLAEERAFGRKVVVKVLPPTLGGGVNIERFQREIQVSAKLQHAHIVPVLTAGETDGVPYYTMPFVEGESLRATLARGPMPIADVVSVLRDVARALAYAHEHGVVHRDIKPDNIMLSGGSAVVADFGIAKAISASRVEAPNATLTQVGTSLGTPSYMAPEQAAADPATDHRADLYALGCTAYEMLAGQPPFVEKSPQQLLAAHMAKTPDPIEARRPDTPPALAALVMQCLRKEPSERPGSAADIAHALDAAGSGIATATTYPVLATPGTLKRAIAFYAVAFVAVLILAKAAVVGIGLPDWVLPGSVIIMALGLPAILVTAYVHRVAGRAATTPALSGAPPSAGPHGTLATLAIKASPHVSWRRTMLGGAYAIGTFVLLIGAFMGMRALGIGPAGSLMGAGKISASDQILVADFRATGNDTALSGVVAEAMRSTLSQSRTVRVVPVSAVVAALDRMSKPTTSRIDEALAKDIATREGIKGIVTGELTPVSGGYLVTVRLIAAKGGDVLATFQQSASSATEIIKTIDQLGRKLRGKIGESLKLVQNGPALEKVTTPSLEALRKYTDGARANDIEREYNKSVALLDSAIQLDSNFAMAYRKLSIALTNRNGGDPRIAVVLDRAYARRAQFAEAERLALLAEYYRHGSHADRAQSVATYNELLRKYPEWLGVVANNYALTLASRRDYARAESLYTLAIRERPETNQPYGNIIPVLVAEGKFDDALKAVTKTRSRPSLATGADRTEARVLYASGNVDSATVMYTRAMTSSNRGLADNVRFDLGTLALREGRLRDWARYWKEGRAILQSRGASLQLDADSMTAVDITMFIRDDTAAARRLLNATIAHMSPAERQTRNVAQHLALLGDVPRAKAIVAHLDSALTDSVSRRLQGPDMHGTRGTIAFAEKQYTQALTEFRLATMLPDGPASSCPICDDFGFALVAGAAGMPDSAIAALEHFVKTPYIDRLNQDALLLAPTLRKLGELYEAKNDPAKAMEYYERFLDLWKHADPELQPQVVQVRLKLQRLQEAQRKKG